MITRILLAACVLFGSVPMTFAAEESSNRTFDNNPPDPRSGRRPTLPGPQPQPPQVYRPAPPPPPSFRLPPPPQVYREPPRREVYREPFFRPLPPPVIYRPAPRLSYTCQTRRFECELRRPLPIGDDCECRTPSGNYRSGEVVAD